MSFRDVIEHALRVYYVDRAEPNAIARELLAQYDAGHRAEVITAVAKEAARRLSVGKSRTVSKDAVLRFLRLEASVARVTAAGEKSSPAGADATPGFFQPGHTYTRQTHGATAEFQVRSIDAHPDHGGPVAFGWYRRRPRTSWHPYSQDNTDRWTNTAARKDGRS